MHQTQLQPATQWLALAGLLFPSVAPAAAQATALQFYGGGVVQIPLNNPTAIPSSGFSVTGWVSVEANEAAPPPGQVAVLVGRCPEPGQPGWALVYRSDRSIAFAWESSPGNWLQNPPPGSGVPVIVGWDYVGALVSPATNTVALVIDTNPVVGIGEVNATLYNLSAGTPMQESPFAGGACGSGGAGLVLGHRFRGRLDDLSLWTATLSANFAYSQSALPLNCASANLGCAWLFEEGAGDTAYASGPLGLSGMLTPGPSPDWIESGYWGQGFQGNCQPADQFQIAAMDLTVGGGRSASAGMLAESSVTWLAGQRESVSANFRSIGGLGWGAHAASGPGPFIVGVLPPDGSSTGGEPLRVIGQGFATPGSGITTVNVGSAAAAGVLVASDTHIQLTNPSGTDLLGNPIGRANVRVANALGASELASGFDYKPFLNAPYVQSVPGQLSLSVKTDPSRFVFLAAGQPLASGIGLPAPPNLGQFVLLQWFIIVDQALLSAGAKSYALPVPAGFLGKPLSFQAISVDLAGISNSSFTNVLTLVPAL